MLAFDGKQGVNSPWEVAKQKFYLQPTPLRVG